jgi:C4-dicarboxylate-specific signal transduction histidine kinase
MASALAHEINQPMTAARALARSVQQILRSPTADTGRADGNLAVLIAQIDHASDVVRRMREFLRRGQPRFSTLDIGDVLDDALMLAGPDAAAKGIAIELVVDALLPPIFGDRVQLQQVVLNLIHNAVEAITETGRNDGCRFAIPPLRSALSTMVSAYRQVGCCSNLKPHTRRTGWASACRSAPPSSRRMGGASGFTPV